MSAFARLEIRNRLDPVDPKKFLRRSESLAMRRRDADDLIRAIGRLSSGGPMVHASDQAAYAELIKVAAKAIESATNILLFASDEIEREVARAEFALGKSAL
jgi:hypothetical protein